MIARLRILALSDKLYGGGSVKRYNKLLREFIASGHEVYHFAPMPIKDLLQFKNCHWNKICCVPIPPRAIAFSFLSSIAVARLLWKVPINAAVIFNPVHAVPIIILKRLLKKDVKVILSLRSDIIITTKTRFSSPRALQVTITPYLAFLGKLESYALAGADLVIFQSIIDRETYCKRHHLPSDKSNFKVIYNGIDKSVLTCAKLPSIHRSDNDKNEWVIGYVGRLSRIKNVDYLIKAFAKLLADLSNIRLVIVGDGPEKGALIRLAKKLKCEQQIEWIGWVQDPVEHILRMDVLVIPSVFDWTPNVVLEGLACERVVIGSRVGGIIEQLKYEDLMFEPKDPDSLALKLKQIVTDIDYYKHLRQLCIDRKQMFLFNWAYEVISVVEETCSGA